MPERRNAPFTDELIRLAFACSPSGTLVVDSDGRIVLASSEVLRIFGYSEDELLGRQVELLVPDRSGGSHGRLRREYGGAPTSRRMGQGRVLTGKRKDGIEVPVEIGLNPTQTIHGLFVVATVVDVSARLQAEQRLRESEKQVAHLQKLDALGTLAGGIAHEFNNVLMTIVGYAELLRGGATGDGAASADLDAILTAARRGGDVVAELQLFTRQSAPPSSTVHLDRSVARALTLLRITLPANISLESSLDPETPSVVGHDGHVQQIVMNLGANAARAMLGCPGTLTVRVCPLRVGASDETVAGGVKPGLYACLEVRDTGTGMTPEVRNRIFDPFFTTEGQSQATGLGLAVVHGIVQEHQGFISVDSELGKGTVFRVLLPATEAAEENREAKFPRAPYLGMRALWVDDEPQLAALGKRQLAHWGIEVQTHSSSLQALEAFVMKPTEFDFVITDNIMPNMSGLELLQQLKLLRPELPTLMVTGDSSDLSPAVLEAHGVDLVLPKPFGLEELQQALGDLLGGFSASGRRLPIAQRANSTC